MHAGICRGTNKEEERRPRVDEVRVCVHYCTVDSPGVSTRCAAIRGETDRLWDTPCATTRVAVLHYSGRGSSRGTASRPCYSA